MFETSEIKYVKGKNVDYIQFKRLLKYGIKHAYTLRGKNVDFSKYGKESEESYKKLCEELELDPKNLCIPIQTHTEVVKCIGEDKEDVDFENVDGLITNRKEKILISRNADCILFLLYDPQKKVIANVHSGWRGTFQKIVEKAVVKMRDNYGSNPEDIICCICPSIRKCHFLVHKDVQEPFYNEFKDLKEIDEIIVPVPGEDRWSIDTVKINEVILRQAGMQQENIIDCGICSVCNSDLIHSFRVEKEGYGLGTAVIELC